MNEESLGMLTDRLKLADEIMSKLGIEASETYMVGLSPVLSSLSYTQIVEAGQALRADLEEWREAQPTVPYPWFRLVNQLDLGSRRDPDVFVSID